ncbi:MAG: hypothetical protein A2283_17360 [Lentisphaerae bacterium RIFOXYA12_FULL_48_11]|nr:MAG: hypothetical protein A2283_17360 [Lentisphaerae bacterium RIFOXYA12_FULL_48_11]
MILLVISLHASRAGMVVEKLKCEYASAPYGVEVRQPRLSWVLWMNDRSTRLEGRGQMQTAYRILVSSSELHLRHGRGDLWDSGKVESSQSFHVRYQGRPLQSRQQCFWKVQVFDKDGKPTEWSDPAFFEMGFLDPDDWSPAVWIGMEGDARRSSFSKRKVQVSAMLLPDASESFPSPLLRKEFEVTRKVVRARAYVCGLGYYELYINGKKVGEQVLDPGQTTYDVRAFYAVHDITTMVNPGRNAAGVWLGNGFYGQNVAFAAKGLAWGQPVMICKIVIDYNDGSSSAMVSDESWKTSASPLVFDNVYAGETYDARMEHYGWNKPGFNDFSWQKAIKVQAPCSNLTAQVIPPIKRMNVILPKRISSGRDEKWIFDLGQNISGWARIRVNEPAGTHVTLRFAEVLAADGKALDVSTLGIGVTGVDQSCVYICKGSGWEVWEPRFAYHGFRYVEVDGLARKPPLEMLEGIHVRTSVEPRGDFICSDDLLNRVYRTSLWTIEGNLHSVPEDCPHREKSARLGDVNVFSEACIYNFDMAQFLSKFMGDVGTVLGRGGKTYEEKDATPGIPCNIAVGRRLGQEARPDWGAAIVMVPWYLYLYYEDTDVVASQYENMKRFVDHVDSLAKENIVYQGYGDWSAPGGNKRMECPVELSSTAYHYRTLVIMERFASILGKTDDTVRFWAAAQKTKNAFNIKFFDKEKMSYGGQTANVLSLRFGLVPEGKEKEVGLALADDIARRQGHSWAGMHGSRSIYTTLCDQGFDNVAYEAITKTNFPSYAFALSLGLTTWPETLADSPDGRAVASGSFNHPMQSGFAAWFHEGLAGIRPMDDVPGFKRVQLKPYGYRQIVAAKAWHNSMYGQIYSSWTNTNGRFEWTVSVPPNTTAVAYVPTGSDQRVEENGVPAGQSPGIKFLRHGDGRAVYEIESGWYEFKSRL